MKYYFSLFFLLVCAVPVAAQEATCGCARDSIAYADCDTQQLKDHSFLYWQYNCDSAWLTLGKINGDRRVINVVREIPQITYRIGYNLINEYPGSLFFRTGCAANGPCNYVVVDKNSGKVLKEFQQEEDAYVIDIYDMNNSRYKYNFIAYFTVGSDSLFIYQINERRTLAYPFRGKLSYPHPEASFEIVSVKGNVIRLTYRDRKYREKAFTIQL